MSHRQLVYVVVHAAFGIRHDFQLAAQSAHFLEAGRKHGRDERRLLRGNVRVGRVERDKESKTGEWIAHASNTST